MLAMMPWLHGGVIMNLRTRVFRTITGRPVNTTALTQADKNFLARILGWYERNPDWTEFSARWTRAFRESGLSPDSLAYRICQDLEARLGIAQGRVSPPDYRDYLADLIELRYGSRYKFCKETGVDPGQLSRVLSGRANLSLEALSRVLDALQAVLVVESRRGLRASTSPALAARALAFLRS